MKKGFTPHHMKELKNRIQRSLKNGAGFTLIELLVVISLIGVLMGILLVAFQGTRKSARDGRRKADLEQIRSALEIYRTDVGSYPGTLSPLTPNYMAVEPKDPLDPTRQYSYNPEGDTYTLCAALEIDGSSVSGCGSCGVPCTYAVYSPGKAPPATPTPLPSWICEYSVPPPPGLCKMPVGFTFPSKEECFLNCPGLAKGCPWKCTFSK